MHPKLEVSSGPQNTHPPTTLHAHPCWPSTFLLTYTLLLVGSPPSPPPPPRPSTHQQGPHSHLSVSTFFSSGGSSEANNRGESSVTSDRPKCSCSSVDTLCAALLHNNIGTTQHAHSTQTEGKERQPRQLEHQNSTGHSV